MNIKEIIKSIFLFLLVGLSLYLTYQLWYGQRPADLVAEELIEQVVVERPRALTQIVTPAEIKVAGENGYFLLREKDPNFNLLWQALSQAIQRVSREAIVEEVIPNTERENMITYRFEPKLPVGEDLPWLSGLAYATISEISYYKTDQDRGLTIADSASSLVLRVVLSTRQSAIFESLLEALTDSDQLVYQILTAEQVSGATEREVDYRTEIFLPRQPIVMDRLLVAPEALDREQLLKTFFVDASLARVIEERDGGLLYTDGERGLRLFNNGLEYSHPRLEAGPASGLYRDALITASSLLGYHGGWLEGLRLERLIVSGWGQTTSYQANWRRYYKGLPLLMSRPTRIIFNDRGLLHYSRSLVTIEGILEGDAEEEPVAAAWDAALEVALYEFNLLPDLYETTPVLEDIRLAYVVAADETGALIGEPVWSIQLSGRQFILHLHTLTKYDQEAIL